MSNKDVVFSLFIMLWLLVDILVIMAWEGNPIFYVHPVFIIALCVLILAEIRSARFNRWLNRDFRKKN